MEVALMTDDRIRSALKGALDPIDPPARLLQPERLVQRQRTLRRRLSVAAAAVLLAVTAFSPLGAKTLAAAEGLVMTFRLEAAPAKDTQIVRTEAGDTARPGRLHLKPGGVEEVPTLTLSNGLKRFRTVYRGTTLDEVLQQVPDQALPTYLAPTAGADAVVVETYDGERINDTTYWVTYPVQAAGQQYELQWRYVPGAPLVAGEPVIMPFTDPGQLRSEPLTVNGRPATAVSLDQGATWAIPWQADDGQGFVGGNLPLDELRKVAESIPLLQP
jgi:hypothetical protein